MGLADRSLYDNLFATASLPLVETGVRRVFKSFTVSLVMVRLLSNIDKFDTKLTGISPIHIKAPESSRIP